MKTTQKILALLLCGVMLFPFAGCSPAALFGKTNQYDRVEYNAWTDENGNTYAVSADGKVVKMTGDVDGGFVLPGGKNAVYVDENSENVFLLNMKNGKSKKIGSKAWIDEDMVISSGISSSVMMVQEQEESEQIEIYEIYDIKRNKTIDSIQAGDFIGTGFGDGPFRNTMNAVAYIKDGQLYTYAADAKKVQKLGPVDTDKDIATDCISRNGKAVVFWERKKGNEQAPVTVKAQFGKTQTEVCTLNNVKSLHLYYAGVVAEVSADGKTAVVFGGGKLYLIKQGKVEQEFSIDDKSYGYYYTDKNYLKQDSGSIGGIYVGAEDAVYYCDFKGNKTKVIGDVTNFEIKNNKIYYIKNEALYAAKIKKGKVSDETRIGTNVKRVTGISGDGKYIYFVNKSNTLYAYRFGEDIAKQVSTNICGAYITLKGDEAIVFSESKVARGRDNYPYTIYTMQKYSYKKDALTDIAKDVNLNVITGMMDYIDASNFVYPEYAGTAKDGSPLWDFKHYNGKKSETVLADVNNIMNSRFAD